MLCRSLSILFSLTLAVQADEHADQYQQRTGDLHWRYVLVQENMRHVDPADRPDGADQRCAPGTNAADGMSRAHQIDRVGQGAGEHQ